MTALWSEFLHRSSHGAASSGRKKVDLWISDDLDCRAASAAVRPTAVVGRTEAANPPPSLTHNFDCFKILLFFKPTVFILFYLQVDFLEPVVCAQIFTHI
jgi:hypothetical protein